MFDLKLLSSDDAKNLNPQVLAFVGDAVYSMYIRHKKVLEGGSKGTILHNEVTNYVKASGQSRFIEQLLPLFDETEMSVFKRARNHKTLSQSKNANIVDYHRATGFEAVIGYLYLIGNENRINELLKLSVGEKDES